MAIEIKHAFTSPKSAGSDATLVQPTHWNAAHNTNMASGRLVGRLTAGAGAFEEIPISAFMAGLLTSADATALGAQIGMFTTGDVKFSYAASMPGWLLLATAGESLGNVGSTATYAGAEFKNLYTIVWQFITETYCPMVSGPRGASALSDWDAARPMYLPRVAGRAIVAAGIPGGGLTNREGGEFFGAETTTLTLNQLPGGINSAGTNSISVTSTEIVGKGGNIGVFVGGGAGNVHQNPTLATATSTGNNSISVFSNNTAAAGNGIGAAAGHSNAQLSAAIWPYIKV